MMLPTGRKIKGAYRTCSDEVVSIAFVATCDVRLQKLVLGFLEDIVKHRAWKPVLVI
jgi:hypothetical protein